MNNNTPWYRIFAGDYTSEQPNFYEKNNFPWVTTLENNWEIIRDEVLTLIEENPDRLQKYLSSHTLSFPPKRWKLTGLYFWNLMMHRNCDRCPKTMEILQSIPNVVSCSLSVLEPKSNIKPHRGYTDAHIRCHLGLSIPASLPDCGFQVGEETKSWEEGKAFVFCDAQTHTAWNHSSTSRLVLIIDVIREEFKVEKASICAHVLASFLIQMIYHRSPFLKKKSNSIKKGLYKICWFFLRIMVPVQRKLRI